eukprot:scaffold4708_cov75-Phaeocystis_antarctica.AAC.1
MRTRPSGTARVVSARIRSVPSGPSYGVLANDAVRGSRAAIKRNRMTSGRLRRGVAVWRQTTRCLQQGFLEKQSCWRTKRAETCVHWAASSSCAWRTLVLLLADCDRRRGEPAGTAGIPARPFGWSGHGDGTLEPLSAMRVATSSGRSAEFGTAPGPHGSDRPASVAVQGELDIGADGVVSELGEVSGSVSASGEVGRMGTKPRHSDGQSSCLP